MEVNRLIRLNDILRQASEQHPIAKYDDCRLWFQGSNEAILAQVAETTTLFNEALACGYINQWAEPGETGWYWDWTGDAIRKAQELHVSLVCPIGNLFERLCNRITTPSEMTQSLDIDKLDDDVCRYANRVYEEHVRYVVTYQEKPVAAIVTLVDLELVKDIQTQVDPRKWDAWIQDVRKRLGWPAATLNEKEEGPC